MVRPLMSDLHFHSRALKPSESGALISIDPRSARWEHISFEVMRLHPGETRDARADGKETCLVFLGGTGSVLSSEGNFDEVGERANVFEGRAHTVYLPVGARFSIKARTKLEVAVCQSAAAQRFPAKWVRPDDVEVEERGDGNASRTIHHVIKPEFQAEKLMVVEVFTPSGNWSSYPPHKHDQHLPPKEHDLEEIYYYRIDRPEGFAIQRVYTDDRRIDETLTCRDGDLVLVREGYHPVVAAPGCNVYYLNVLAGTGRSMAATDDPTLAWVRETWKRPQRAVR